MKKIVVQPGHINTQFNCDPNLRTSTGAPGEQEFTLRIANKLSEVLRTKGFEVKQVDANANCDATVTGVDWDLFLAVHYDADVYQNPREGGFVDYPEPNTDAVTQESQRIKKEIEGEYFKHSGIINVPNRSNVNTRFYYMWKNLSAKTPCVIIECGVGKDPHDSVILADTNRVANAIARGVCKAFDVNFDVPIPPTDPCASQNAQIANFKKVILEATGTVEGLRGELKVANDRIAKFKELAQKIVNG